MADTMLTGGADAATEFVTTLLNGVTTVHMHHLMVTGPGSYAKHMALGDLYSALEDGADSLAEAYIGCTGKAFKFEGGTLKVGTDPVAEVAALYAYVESKRGAMGKESHIQNLIDEIADSLASALYKLRRLA